MPPKPHKDQSAPKAVSPTGVAQPMPLSSADPRAQSGEYLTTAQGLRLADTDHSLKAGPRGPVLLEDFHLREKITHFDHERIPERVVHARGAAAHGTFLANGWGGLVQGRISGQGEADAGVHPVLHRARFTGRRRHGAGRTRVRGEDVHR